VFTPPSLSTGTAEQRTVNSDPTDPDSDNDGLRDGPEYASTGDPRQDTDLDGVADLDEYALYASKLYHADGDGDSLDASGNRDPSLFDGQEVNRLQTSPADTDTDGDSFTDL
jgi:hypothetical protein